MIILILSMLLSSKPVQLPQCGKGPVEISVYVPGGDCNKTTCNMERNPDGSYTQSMCVTTTMMCWTEVKKKYTDYPECGGTEITENMDTFILTY